MAVLRARQLNQWMGAQMVGPWDLEQDPEKYADWIYVAEALAQIPAMQKRQQDVAHFFKVQDLTHKTYLKYRH